MATKLLYVNQPGSMLKIFEKVRHAQTPDRFTIDFLQTKLGLDVSRSSWKRSVA